MILINNRQSTRRLILSLRKPSNDKSISDHERRKCWNSLSTDVRRRATVRRAVITVELGTMMMCRVGKPSAGEGVQGCGETD